MKMNSNTILITGGSSGIGLELAKQFLALGNTVIITGRDAEKLRLAKARLPGVTAIQGDVGDPTAIQDLHRRVLADFPRLNLLVNNAGIMRNLDLNDSMVGLTDVVQEIATNLSGPLQMVQQFLPLLKSNQPSAIVNVSSGLAFIPFAFSPVYGATKAAIHSYSQALRAQLRGTGIQVFELAPPATTTALMEAFGPGLASGHMNTAALVAAALKGFGRNQTEILPGAAKALKLMSRIAPKFFFNRLNNLFARLLSQPEKMTVGK